MEGFIEGLQQIRRNVLQIFMIEETLFFIETTLVVSLALLLILLSLLWFALWPALGFVGHPESPREPKLPMWARRVVLALLVISSINYLLTSFSIALTLIPSDSLAGFLQAIDTMLGSPLPLLVSLAWFLLRHRRNTPNDGKFPKNELKSNGSTANLISFLIIILALNYHYFNDTIESMLGGVYVSAIFCILAINIDRLTYFFRANRYTDTLASAKRLAQGQGSSTKGYFAEIEMLEAELNHRDLNAMTASLVRATLDTSRDCLNQLSDSNTDDDAHLSWHLSWIQEQLKEARVLLRAPSSEEIALLRAFFFFVSGLTFYFFIFAPFSFEPFSFSSNFEDLKKLADEALGIPPILVITSALGSVTSLLYEYVKREGSVLGSSRSLFFRPLLGVILSSVTYLAITTIVPPLQDDIRNFTVTQEDTNTQNTDRDSFNFNLRDESQNPDRAAEISALRARFALLSILGFLTGFFEEIPYRVLAEARKRLGFSENDSNNTNNTQASPETNAKSSNGESDTSNTS